ncbi:hypothetical protein PHYBOEH_010418 [Phytophthora boehmeriae]|uniref:Uncharacterized protein n=1 Tax=Phytophthora boehmeriae TaxID=109152 RepID=A0A8T1WZB0_9STRA|nr:hypothetical protein PHYBOEH_010418 [Phytophthora boehmeriae]
MQFPWAARVVAVALCLLLQPTDALRSCTKHGQVRVPCEDDLLLGRSDKFLLTLFGHSCYTMNIASPEPLEVLFYDSRDLQTGRQEDGNAGQRRLGSMAEQANESDALSVLGDSTMCQNVLSCYQLQPGLSKATVYNLVISRWTNSSTETTDDEEDTPIPVSVELEHCDPVSPWHYVGLVFVGSVGFTSTFLLLCVIGEFVLGLRTISKLQNARKPDRFVEMPHVDPLKNKNSEDPEEPTAPLMTTVLTPRSDVVDESETPEPA